MVADPDIKRHSAKHHQIADMPGMQKRWQHRMGLPVTILIGAVSVIVPNTLPAFLGIVAIAGHLSEAQSGLAAMADLAGITIGTIGCAMSPALVQHLGWRRMAMIGLGVLIGGNVLSVYAADFSPYLLVRVLAGLGSGMVMAVVYAILGEGEGARALAFFNIGQLGLGWLAIPVLGPLEERFGVSGIFGAIALSAAAMLLLVPFLPAMSKREEEAEAHHAHAPEKVTPEGWLAILSVFVLYFGAGSVYSFLEFMGIAWGGAKADVENALALVLMKRCLRSLIQRRLKEFFRINKKFLHWQAHGLISARHCN